MICIYININLVSNVFLYIVTYYSMLLLSNFIKGDEFYVQDLLSNIIFNCNNIRAILTSDTNSNDMNVALQIRSLLFWFYNNGIASKETCEGSRIFSCRNISLLDHISIDRQCTSSILPLPYDWLYLPFLNLSSDDIKEDDSNKSLLLIKV